MLTWNYDFEEVNAKFQSLVERINDSAIVHSLIGEVILAQHRQRFEDEVDPDGNEWDDLSQLTLLLRNVKTGKLRVSGDLFRSLHKSTSAASAQVGTNLNHPKVFTHQYGATIKPIRGPFLVVPGKSKGDAPTLLEKAVVPARPYIGIGDGDEDAIADALLAYLSE